MRKCTKNTAKFGKLLELIYNMKIRMMETNHWPEMCAIDERARKLYDIYKNDNSNSPDWKQRRAHGYLKYYYKQQQQKKATPG